MKHLTKNNHLSNIESAARKFAAIGAMGLGVVAASERNAAAEQKRAEQPPFEPMPVYVLGGKKQIAADTEVGSYTFNSRTASVLRCDAMAGLSLDKEGGSAIAIGPSFESFVGYGTYRGPAGYVRQNMEFSGHSAGLGAMLKLKLGISGNPAELVGYGNAGYQTYEKSFHAGAGGNPQNPGDSGMHMGRAGLELRIPAKSTAGIGNLGLGMVSDPRNAFAFVSAYIKLHESGQLEFRTTVAPHASMMTGDFVGGMDLRPVEMAVNRDALGIAAGPGFKYEYNPAMRTSTMAPYMAAYATIGKRAGTHIDLSFRSGYLTEAGSQKALPGGMFGGLQLGLIF